jgi:hypothetical protein
MWEADFIKGIHVRERKIYHSPTYSGLQSFIPNLEMPAHSEVSS